MVQLVHCRAGQTGGPAFSFLGALVAAILVPASAHAQWFDAALPRGGEVRVGIAAGVTDIDERFNEDGSSVPLSDMFAVELDSRLVPELDTLDTALDDLFSSLGLQGADKPAIGTVRYDVLIERSRFPLRIDVGLRDWVTFSAKVPIVQGKSFTGLLFDSLAAEAGIGSTAFGGNADAFFADLGTAISALEAIVASDTLSPERRSEAETAITTARTLETGLMGLRELEFLPTDSGRAGRELLQLYDQLAADFETFEITLPELALARPPDEELLRGLTSGPRFGIEAPDDRDSGLRLGDIELGLSFQPVNTFPGLLDESGGLIALRARVGALWRFPTGRTPAPNRITDPGSGDGQHDLELSSALDVALGRRFWLSLLGSYNIQHSAEVERLLTSPAAPIQPGAFIAPVRWDPGDELRFAIAPRINLTPVITFSAFYTHVDRGADEVEPVPATPMDGPFQPADLERGSEYTTGSLGFAIRYSGTRWTSDRRPGIPVEVELRYHRTANASGGFALEQRRWEVGFRWYRSLFR